MRLPDIEDFGVFGPIGLLLQEVEIKREKTRVFYFRRGEARQGLFFPGR